MSLERPRAVLFDWDNTLIDSWDQIGKALNATLEAMGHARWTPEEVRARVRASARDAFPRLFGDRADAASRLFFDNYRQLHLEGLRAMPGAGELLALLRDELGVYAGVVSNKQGEFLRDEARHLGWTPYFGRLVGASDAARDKPARAPVELALSGAKAAVGSEVWLVGDTDMDMLCARNSGCVPVLLRAEPPAGDEFGAAPPRLHFADCGALAAALKDL